MGTVTSQLTRILDMEGSLTFTSIGGGAGAAANTDIFIQGSQSSGRRQSNVTLNGFLVDDGAGNDLSATSVHVGAWMWVTHYGNLTALRLRVGSNSGTGNYDEHIVPLTEYPALGGWVRVWVDISRTPDATGGSGLDEATARHFGPIISLPSVGGNAANLIIDAVDHTTGGLVLTGTAGVWSDFVSADEGNSANKYGVVTSQAGVIYVRARLTLGSSSSLVFSDSDFTLVFPQQNLVESTFMGVNCDLQNASTSIAFSRGNLSSPGVRKGDFVVSGTAGTFTASAMTFSGLRALTLNSKCTIASSAFVGCGPITHGGAVTTGCSVSGYEGAANTSALIYDVAADPVGEMDNMTFTKGAAATHAIEFGTSSPTTITLSGITFSGYHASNGQNDSAVHIKRTAGTVTINVSGGTTPSYRTDGATVIVQSSVTVTLTGLKNPSEVRVYDAGTTTERTGTGAENVTTGSHAFSLPASTAVDISILALTYQNERILNYSTTISTSVPVSQKLDRQYQNP